MTLLEKALEAAVKANHAALQASRTAEIAEHRLREAMGLLPVGDVTVFSPGVTFTIAPRPKKRPGARYWDGIGNQPKGSVVHPALAKIVAKREKKR